MGEVFITRRGAGGAGIRVKVYASAELLPASAVKNTIAVISDIAVGQVYIGRPDNPSAGDIYLAADNGTQIDLNGASLLTVGAYQYDGTEWGSKSAYAYIDREWTEIGIGRRYIYYRGTSYTDVIGGWTKVTDANGIVTWGDESLYLGYSGSSARYASVYTKNRLSLQGYSKIVVVASNTYGEAGFAFGVLKSPYTGASLSNAKEVMTAYQTIPLGLTQEATYELDVSALDDMYYLQLVAGISHITIHSVYLE